MAGFRTIDLSDDVVKSRKIGPQEVKLGASAHYTKLTDIDGAFIVFTSPNEWQGGKTVKHSLGRIPTGFMVIRKDKSSVVWGPDGACVHWTAAHITIHCHVHQTNVHAIVF